MLATAIDAREAEKKHKTFKETAEIWGRYHPEANHEIHARYVREVSLKNPIRPLSQGQTDAHSSRKEKKRALARSFAKLVFPANSKPSHKLCELSNV